jgi:hypothetical protein
VADINSERLADLLRNTHPQPMNRDQSLNTGKQWIALWIPLVATQASESLWQLSSAMTLT